MINEFISTGGTESNYYTVLYYILYVYYYSTVLLWNMPV